MKEKSNLKIIIIGAGLGGLINGILLKKANPGNEVVIYDSNKIPGGFCTSFQKTSTFNNEKIKYNEDVIIKTFLLFNLSVLIFYS